MRFPPGWKGPRSPHVVRWVNVKDAKEEGVLGLPDVPECLACPAPGVVADVVAVVDGWCVRAGMGADEELALCNPCAFNAYKVST